MAFISKYRSFASVFNYSIYLCPRIFNRTDNMSHLAPLIADLALILVCAGIMTLLFKN